MTLILGSALEFTLVLVVRRLDVLVLDRLVLGSLLARRDRNHLLRHLVVRHVGQWLARCDAPDLVDRSRSRDRRGLRANRSTTEVSDRQRRLEA